ncbi:Glycosyltransferase involved in cell wall bisynthesis [Lachnospiraceae bacterium]|nr:Glycosyltransferase involved in cell wall bisynthesis [Lachnospiraceae bacterium]
MTKAKTRKKIAVIGPVYPFKGGISHYTGLLVRALSERFKVRTVSYSMQYPKILFKKEQRNWEDDSFKIDGTEYLINTANPFNIIAAARNINKWKPDLVIIEWWHPYFAPCYQILCSALKSKVLFTCHNVFPHERFPMDRMLTKMTLKKGDYFILHSEREADEIKTIIPHPAYRVNMHPTYNAFQMAPVTDRSSDEKIILFFGFVRPYKGLHVLIPAMAECPDVRLMIVGDFGGHKAEYEAQIKECGIGDRTEIHDGYIPDNEVQKYFEQADAVILPYIDATQSGIAQIAFGFRKPVIATEVGGLPEVVTDGETGVLCKPNDPKALADSIKRFYEIREQVDFGKNIDSDSERFSWGHMVNTISELADL